MGKYVKVIPGRFQQELGEVPKPTAFYLEAGKLVTACELKATAKRLGISLTHTDVSSAQQAASKLGTALAAVIKVLPVSANEIST